MSETSPPIGLLQEQNNYLIHITTLKASNICTIYIAIRYHGETAINKTTIAYPLLFYYWQSLPGSASRLSLQLESTFNFMANYKILLRDNSNPDNNRNQYSAEQFANNELEAKEEIKLFYSQELDTNTDQIEVLSIVKL